MAGPTVGHERLRMIDGVDAIKPASMLRRRIGRRMTLDLRLKHQMRYRDI